MSHYSELMDHAREFGKFDVIEGHRHGKIAPPAPAQSAPTESVEVDWQGHPLQEKK